MKIYPNIEGLVEFDVPKTWSEIKNILINSMDKSNFDNDGNMINNSIDRRYNIDSFGNVTINKEIFENEYIFNVENGKLVGRDEGEFIGELLFVNNENKVEYSIINDNICGITNFKNNIYVLTGLAHMGGNRGNIIKINYINKIWKTENIINLEACPEIFSIFDDQMYIITADGLVIFDGININKVLSDQFWQNGLYPKTIFINNDIIAIGLRGCIAIIDKNTYDIKCYK